jgi:hypothetical protein
VLADEAGGVIAGHAAILAARQLGYAEVPVMVARGWSDAQKRAYVIADNQLALNAGWDRELLGLELGELKLGGFDLALTGFGELELGDLLADRTQGLTDPDDAPAAPEHPVSRTGDLWLLGGHRLHCGDCAESCLLFQALIVFCSIRHIHQADNSAAIESRHHQRNMFIRALRRPAMAQEFRPGDIVPQSGIKHVGEIDHLEEAHAPVS